MLKLILAVAGGGALGWLYHRVVGCRSGACPITANAWSSVLYGAMLGFMMAH